MTVFGKKIDLTKLYEKWIKENGIEDCAHSVIVFMCCHDLLNTDNALMLIEKMKGGKLYGRTDKSI